MSRQDNSDQLAQFMMRPSYYEAVQQLPRDKQDQFFGALARYGIAGQEPDFDDQVLVMLFALARPNIDASAKFCSAGHKGGRPAGNKSPLINPPLQASAKRDSDSEREMESESDLSDFPNGKSSPSPADTGGASAGAQKSHSVDEQLRQAEEFEFYIWCFNKIFGRIFTSTTGRRTKFKTRRKKFSLLQLITSLQVAVRMDFYRGDNDRHWQITPDFHLESDEHVARFLEMPETQAQAEYIADHLPRLKREYWAWKKEHHAS